ncbi:hypothetical protein AAMO2058_000453400 [Amorphochlora amoebiformis]
MASSEGDMGDHLGSNPFFWFHIGRRKRAPKYAGMRPAKVVFLHGWCQSHACWLKTATRIRDRYGHQSLLLDFYGHGKSPYPTDFEELSPDFLVQQVRDAVKAVGWENESLVFAGISLGASIALRYAEKYPNSASSFVFIAPSGMEEGSFCLSVAGAKISRAVIKTTKRIKNMGLGLGRLLRFWPVTRALSHLNLISHTPSYGVCQKLEYVRGKFFVVLLGQYDFIHTPQVRKWKKAGVDSVGTTQPLIIVKPFQNHVTMCVDPDRWRVDLIPEAWSARDTGFLHTRPTLISTSKSVSTSASTPLIRSKI